MGVCFPMDRCREGNGGCEQTCSSQNGEALCSCKCGPSQAVYMRTLPRSANTHPALPTLSGMPWATSF